MADLSFPIFFAQNASDNEEVIVQNIKILYISQNRLEKIKFFEWQKFRALY